jgi:hypothetical protein
LNRKSQKLRGIVLPRGRYVYNQLPQGCLPSSDIFQGHMAKLFYEIEDLIAYIDNIIFFTKKIFEQHVKFLTQVIECICQQNLHLYVEETFLAS